MFIRKQGLTFSQDCRERLAAPLRRPRSASSLKNVKPALMRGDGSGLELAALEIAILLPLFAVAIATAIQALRGLMQ